MARGRGRGRGGFGSDKHEVGSQRGSLIGDGIDVHMEEQTTSTTSQSRANPQPSETQHTKVLKVEPNLPTLHPNGRM